MTITLNKASKKYNKHVVFKDISTDFSIGNIYGITGRNGAGKSTLLKSISGYSRLFSGEINFFINNELVEKEEHFNHISWCAPYIDLPEEMTTKECFEFHQKLDTNHKLENLDSLLEKVSIIDNADKQIKHFSSGMKQRLKLALTLHTNRPIILLDEPTSNLDEQGCNWFFDALKSNDFSNKIIIIASNLKEEIAHCGSIININDYKI